VVFERGTILVKTAIQVGQTSQSRAAAAVVNAG